jgi:DNA mismatch repair protein MutL
MYSQELLFPVSINLTINELMIVKELSEELTKLGYRLIFKGSDLVEIHSVPHDIKSGEETASFKEIINQFDENRKIGTPEKRDNLAASFSCKAAIKTGKKLNNDEIRQLLKDLFACSVPYVCPHGRPVIIELSLDELDKMFRRK